MTQHNVGSLLVFEPENAEAARVGAAPHGSAVVGIVTERGAPDGRVGQGFGGEEGA